MKALFDTNILIDYLNAVPEARVVLDRYEQPSISIVTFMEVLVGTPAEFEQATRMFLAGFDIVALDNEIAEHAVRLRKQRRIKLPDAIIQATADIGSLLLVTRNTRDFSEGLPNVHIPY